MGGYITKDIINAQELGRLPNIGDRASHISGIVENKVIVTGGNRWSEDKMQKIFLDNTLIFDDQQWIEDHSLPIPMAFSMFSFVSAGLYVAGGTSDEITMLKEAYVLRSLQKNEKLMPTCRTEVQYLHPGSKHINFASTFVDEEPKGSLNRDLHWRSFFFGQLETIPLVEGNLSLDDFEFIYFIDWDKIRERKRVCEVQIMGE